MDSAAAHPLDGSRGKLVRAKQQAALLSQLCDEYAESEPYQLVCRFERGSGVPIDQSTFGAYEFRNGKALRTEWFANRGEALKAAGLAE